MESLKILKVGGLTFKWVLKKSTEGESTFGLLPSACQSGREVVGLRESFLQGLVARSVDALTCWWYPIETLVAFFYLRERQWPRNRGQGVGVKEGLPYSTSPRRDLFPDHGFLVLNTSPFSSCF